MKLTRAILLALAFVVPSTASFVARAEDKPAAEGEKKPAKKKKGKKAEGEGEKKEGEAAPAEKK